MHPQDFPKLKLLITSPFATYDSRRYRRVTERKSGQLEYLESENFICVEVVSHEK